MKRSTRLASTAVAALLAVGIAGPALADPGHGGGNGGHGGGHHAPVPQVLSKDLKSTLRDISHLDKRLAGVAKDQRLKRLTADDQAAVVANVTADRANLAALVVTVQAATSSTDLKQIRAGLKQVRPENYTLTVNDLRAAARLAAASANLRASIDASGTVGTGDARLVELDQADALIAQAVDAARLVTATTDKATLRTIQATLVQAKVSVDAATDATTTDPTPTDPTPTATDTDGDGLSDADEATYGTDPSVADTDADGVSDGDEVTNGTNPLDPTSF